MRKGRFGIRKRITLTCLGIAAIIFIFSVVASEIYYSISNSAHESQNEEMIGTATKIARKSQENLVDAFYTDVSVNEIKQLDRKRKEISDRLMWAAGHIEYLLKNPVYENFKIIEPPTFERAALLEDSRAINDLGIEKKTVVSQMLYGKGVNREDPEVLEEAGFLGSVNDFLNDIYHTGTMSSVYLGSQKGLMLQNDAFIADKLEENGNQKEYDPRQRGWYKGAVQNRGFHFLDPSNAFFTGLICVTYSYPVYYPNGELFGVLGFDYYLDDIVSMFSDNTIADYGYVVILDKNYQILKGPDFDEVDKTTGYSGKHIFESEDDGVLRNAMDIADGDMKTVLVHVTKGGDGAETAVVDGVPSKIYHSTSSKYGWTLLNVYPTAFLETAANVTNDYLRQGLEKSVTDYRNTIDRFNIYVFIFGIILIIVLIIICYIAGSSLAKPIISLRKAVMNIRGDNLDFEWISNHNDEISDLSDSFAQMTRDMKMYIYNLTNITAEKNRIGAELDVATNIQDSMLPKIFPNEMGLNHVDLYATMDPAKEVGGDFYDFFMVDKTHIAIVVADVSGKGVPAALFMVIAKTLIKDHSYPGNDPGQIFMEVNNILCESNSEGLFVTCFEGVLDLVTGEFVYCNAGHEYPFIKKAGGDYEVYKIKPAFVLAGMEDMIYKSGSIFLEPGDTIFQYTDGVTEATDSSNQLFGMERLKKTLNKYKDSSLKDLLKNVRKDIDEFVGEAPQFDDITMLGMLFKERMEE